MVSKKINLGRRGVLGGITGMFVATILIIIILIIFVLFSSFLIKFEGISQGVAVHKGREVGIADLTDYMNSFRKLVYMRFNLAKRINLNEALLEEKNEK